MLTVRELVNLIGFKINESEFASAQNRMVGFQKSLETTGRKMLIGITLPYVGLMTASVRAASKQRAAAAQVAQGIESTGGAAKKTVDGLLESASKFQEASLFGDEDILGGVTATLLSFQNISGEVFDKTQQAILDVTQRLQGADGGMSALHGTALQLGKALNDPIIGLQALNRAGIQFTEAQREEIKTLVKSGNLRKAQLVILDLIEQKFGGSARAALDASFGFKQFSNYIGDFFEVVGESFFPVIKPLMTSLTEFMKSLQKIKPELLTAIVLIGGAAAAIGPLLLGLAGVIKAGMVIQSIFIAMKTASMAAGVSIGLLSLKFMVIAAAVLAVVAAITLLVEDFLVYKSGGKSLIGEMIKWWQKFDEAMGISNLMKEWHDFYFWLGQELFHFVNDTWIPIWEAIGSALFTLVKTIGALWDGIWQKIEPVISRMSSLVKNLKDFWTQPITATDEVKGIFKDLKTFWNKPVTFGKIAGEKPDDILGTIKAGSTGNTIRVEAKIQTYVPEGTTAQAQESIKKTTEDSYNIFMDKLVRQLSYGTALRE